MQLNHTQVTYIQKSFLKLWPGNVYNLVWQVSFKFMHKVLHFAGCCWIILKRSNLENLHHQSIRLIVDIETSLGKT